MKASIEKTVLQKHFALLLCGIVVLAQIMACIIKNPVLTTCRDIIVRVNVISLFSIILGHQYICIYQ